MNSITQVADKIFMIETNSSRLLGEAGFPRSSLVYYVASEKPALVEAGPTAAVPELLDAIATIGDPTELRYVMLTHIHVDHGGGAGELARILQRTTIVVHERGVRHLIDPSRLVEASRKAYGDDFEDQYGPVVPVPEARLKAVTDGDAIDLGDVSLKIVYSPGHASHHICFFDEKERALFSGESLGRPQSTIVAPVSGFDPLLAISTIERLQSLQPKTVLCSHGGVSHEPSGLIASVLRNMKAFDVIIGDAVKRGDSRSSLRQQLLDYQRDSSGTRWNAPSQVDDLIDRYLEYFKTR